MQKPKPTPQLLVSVTSAHEAHIAVDNGAELIDIKDPARGPLGMAERSVIDAVLIAVEGRRPLSVALGELHEHRGIVSLPQGVSFAKVALAGMARSHDWRHRLTALLAPLMVDEALEPHAVVVAYADAERAEAPPVQDVLDWVLKDRATGLLIDTAVKDGKGLFDFLSPAELSAINQRLVAAGKTLALAGSLSGETLERAVKLKPAIVGVRGAACVGRDRMATIDAQAVAALVDMVEAARTAPVATIASA